LLDLRLVRLDGEEAVRAEVLRRLLPHLGHLVAPYPLPVLVEPVEEPRRPAAVALEEPDAETREALEHAAGAAAHGDEHDAQPLAEGVPHDELVEDLEREVGLEIRLAAAVEGDRDAEALALGPQRVVVGVVPGAAGDAAGCQEDRLEAELLHAATGLGPSRRDVERGRHAVTG